MEIECVLTHRHCSDCQTVITQLEAGGREQPGGNAQFVQAESATAACYHSILLALKTLLYQQTLTLSSFKMQTHYYQSGSNGKSNSNRPEMH